MCVPGHKGGKNNIHDDSSSRLFYSTTSSSTAQDQPNTIAPFTQVRRLSSVQVFRSIAHWLARTGIFGKMTVQRSSVQLLAIINDDGIDDFCLYVHEIRRFDFRGHLVPETLFSSPSSSSASPTAAALQQLLTVQISSSSLRTVSEYSSTWRFNRYAMRCLL